MTRMLASVASVAEAEAALRGGAHLIDLKDPTHGALSALDPALVRQVVAHVDHRRPVSATIGDLPMAPDVLALAVRRMAATGVDYLKIGFRPAPGLPACIDAVASAVPGGHLIGVFFADIDPAPVPLAALAKRGFAGVMWDTAHKELGGLRNHVDPARLLQLVDRAKVLRLMVGLAGSLGLLDIEPLLLLEPDYLGFRTALCQGENRAGRLEAAAVARLAARLARRRTTGVAGV